MIILNESARHSQSSRLGPAAISRPRKILTHRPPRRGSGARDGSTVDGDGGSAQFGPSAMLSGTRGALTSPSGVRLLWLFEVTLSVRDAGSQRFGSLATSSVYPVGCRFHSRAVRISGLCRPFISRKRIKAVQLTCQTRKASRDVLHDESAVFGDAGCLRECSVSMCHFQALRGGNHLVSKALLRPRRK